MLPLSVADFEAKMIDPTNLDQKDTPKQHYFEKQVPVSYCLVVFDRFGHVLFRREESHEDNCLDLFFHALDDATEACSERLRMIVPHSLPNAEVGLLKRNAKECILCQGPFNPLKIDHSVLKRRSLIGEQLTEEEKQQVEKTRVIDHDHMTGGLLFVISIFDLHCNNFQYV